MKITFTPAALRQLELVIGTLSNNTGFLIGSEIGKFKIIEELFPLNFDESSIDTIYSKMYSKVGDRLLGVFFNNNEPFFSDWFIEDIIINIKYPQPEFYFYDADRKLIPLTDVELAR
jgi:hypothetical protein